MGSSLFSSIRSISSCGSACALPLTLDVHHGFEWDVCQLVFHFLKKWEGSQGVGIASAPASTGILPSTTGSSTTGCTIATSRLDEPHGFCEVCTPSARTHESCDPSTRTHESCESPARTLDFVNLLLVRMTFVNFAILQLVRMTFVSFVNLQLVRMMILSTSSLYALFL